MKMVLLFFCVIFLLLLMTIFSSIKINIKKCKISNVNNNIKQSLEKEFLVYIEIYLLGLIKIARFKVNKSQIQKIEKKESIKKIENKIFNFKIKPIYEALKRLKLKLEKINLELSIGVDDVIVTSYLVAAISSILGVIIAVSNPKVKNFKVCPLYNIGNSIKINLNCIITVKIVHIIFIIYIFLKRRRSKHERTSNRRSYDYSYE